MSDVPSVWSAAKRAWRDTFTAFLAMPMVAAVALLVTLAIGIAHAFLLRPGDTLDAATLLTTFVTGAVQAFFVTPYLIAVHRMVILGEVMPSYVLAPGDPRFQRFFGWSIVLSLLWFVPTMLGALLFASPVMSGLVTAVVGIALLIVSLRIIILFPAVAVDAPGGTWNNAMADTKGRAWRIFAILLVTSLPLIVIIVLVGIPAADAAIGGAAPSTAWSIFSGFVQGLVNFVSLTLAVVVASRLFQSLGNRVHDGT